MPESKIQPRTGERTEVPDNEPAPEERNPVPDLRSGFRPALFAAYGDLTSLRHPYPLILFREAGGATSVESLSPLINVILQNTAPRGPEGERLRSHVLQLEEEVRMLVSRGSKRLLSGLWDLATENLVKAAPDGVRDDIEQDLRAARAALPGDGELIDCDANTPAEVITHLWRGVEAARSCRFRGRLRQLETGLANMLEVEFRKTPAAWSAERLERSMGGVFSDSFDFALLGKVMQSAACGNPLPGERVARITEALRILRSQRFFAADPDPSGKDSGTVHQFLFESGPDAVRAIEDRKPEMARLLMAMAVAEMELANRYRDAMQVPLAGRFNAQSLTAADLAQFPSCLVLLDASAPGFRMSDVLETAASDLPIKMLVVFDDLLGPNATANRLAHMAVGLNEVFVAQVTSSHLHAMRQAIGRGLEGPATALFSVYAGSRDSAAFLPPYLASSAALEARVFPAFTYDPASGHDGASQFRLDLNPGVELPWTVHHLSYTGDAHERLTRELPFSFFDFIFCDRRFAHLFTPVPINEGTTDMIPASDYLAMADNDRQAKSPVIYAIDESNRLQIRVVDLRVMDAASRCARQWTKLQELGGIRNSHAQKLLEAERATWEEEKAAELDALRQTLAAARPVADIADHGAPAGAVPPVEAPTEEATAVETSPAAPSDEPYIESARCTTCEECIKVNKRMFAYNENKQAYIADPDAGSYADLVRAAEKCQVCIIHPGRPRNPGESDLEELTKRAEPFL